MGTLVVILAFIAAGLLIWLAICVAEIILTDLAERRRSRSEGKTTAFHSNPAPTAAPPGRGAEGESVTPLKPFGFIMIAGERRAAKADFGYIAAGRPVIVTGEDAGTLVVREASGHRFAADPAAQGRHNESEAERPL
jgi:membrane-bound ClpP family serine protease